MPFWTLGTLESLSRPQAPASAPGSCTPNDVDRIWAKAEVVTASCSLSGHMGHQAAYALSIPVRMSPVHNQKLIERRSPHCSWAGGGETGGGKVEMPEHLDPTP